MEHLSDPLAQVLLAVLTPTGTALALLVMLRSYVRSRLQALARLEEAAKADVAWRRALRAELKALRRELAHVRLGNSRLKTWAWLLTADPVKAKEHLPSWEPLGTAETLLPEDEPQKKSDDGGDND